MLQQILLRYDIHVDVNEYLAVISQPDSCHAAPDLEHQLVN
jgi:hypothetical protein